MFTCLFILLMTASWSDAAWYSGWSYRKSHVINAASGAGTNYQVCIKVYSGSGTDGTETVNGVTCGKVYLTSHGSNWPNDIGFTGSDGTTLLDHWKQTSDAASAVFWVKVQEDLSSVNRTIYIYYGKSGQSSASNGTNTFLLFDDFDNLNNWSSGNRAGGTATTSSSLLTLAPAQTWDGVYVRSSNSFSFGNIRAEIRYELTGPPNYCNPCAQSFQISFLVPGQSYPRDNTYYYTITGAALPAPIFACGFERGPHSNTTSGCEAGSGNTNDNFSSCWYSGDYPTSYFMNRSLSQFAYGSGVYYKIGFAVTSSKVTERVYKESDGSTIYDQNANVNSTHYSNFGSSALFEMLSWGYQVSGTKVDWVFVRRFVDSEPSQGAWGSEESPSHSSYKTKVGTAKDWVWKIVYSTDAVNTVPSGTPSDWTWRTWEPGSGRKVPQGTAADWSWGAE